MLIGSVGVILVIDRPTVVLEVGVGGWVLKICGFSTYIVSVCVKNSDIFRFCLMQEVLFSKPKTKRAQTKAPEYQFFSLLSLLRIR